MKITLLCLTLFAAARLVTDAVAAPGDVDAGLNPNLDSYVVGTALQPDGKIIAAGNFQTFNGAPRHHIARISPSGGLDGFNPDADGQIRSVVVQADGKVVIAGIFNNVGGVPRRGLARLHGNGTVDLSLDPQPDAGAQCLAMQADGKILVGGSFTTMGGVPHHHLARINPDGTLDPGFNPDVNGEVFTITVQEDGKILIGGGFIGVNGFTRFYLARLNADGTLDPGFNRQMNNYVYSVVVQPDQKILVGGNFAGVDYNYLERLGADGTLDAGYNPNVNANVGNILAQADGTVVIAGGFSMVGGVARNKIARLSANGTLDASFGANTDIAPSSLAMEGDGRMLLGGSSVVGAVGHNNLVRLDNDAIVQSLTIPNRGRVQWLRGGTAPETQQVTLEVSTDYATTWSAVGSGTRIAGGWEENGLNLPVSGKIRARARVAGSGFSGLVETAAAYNFDPAPLAQWKFSHLGDATAPNAADPDFDGLANILEFATGADPLLPSALPVAGTMAGVGTLTFSRNTVATDVTLTVQGSDNLTIWTDLARSTGGAAMVALIPGVTVKESGVGALRTVAVRDLYAIGDPAHPQRFLRLQAAPAVGAPAAPFSSLLKARSAPVPRLMRR